MADDTNRSGGNTDEQQQRRSEAAPRRRLLGGLIAAALVLIPIGILVLSNLESTEVSWAGFRFDQPLWVVLLATFLAGMVGGKLFGLAWRRYRRRRRRLKEEMAVVRKHASGTGEG